MNANATEKTPNPARVPAPLLERYTTRGPRYTSYPPAPHFSPDIPAGELAARWQAGAVKGPDLSAYVHIPFCAQRCRFCGCFTQVGASPEAADPYLEDMKTEFARLAQLLGRDRPVRQLAFGGGTPTFLTPDRFDRLMRDFREVYTIAADAELSIEMDPRSIRPGHLDVLLSHGFNRFSLGVQDFDPNVLNIIRREQSMEMVFDLVGQLRARGQEAINFDLIYGLPGQTPQTMRATVEQVTRISPSRIALFSYAHVPWMKGHQKILERHQLPNPEEKLALFGLAWDILTDAGYVPIGMDHFARPDDELARALDEGTLHRNFMGYTTRRGLDLVAFGVSGISAVADTYAQNVKELPAYAAAMREGRTAFERGYILSHDDRIRRSLIIDLFCNFQLDGEALARRWQIDFGQYFAQELDALAPFCEDGLLEIDGCRLRVTPLGRIFVRNVCMVFDRYLENDPALRRYSQTV